MQVIRSVVFTGTILLGASLAWSQQTTTGGFGQGGVVAGRTQGLEQTGQLSSSAAIQRDANAFVGSSSGSFLSRSGTTGVTGRATGGVTSGISGFIGDLTTASALGRGIGGGFGLGGGFGGLGNQFGRGGANAATTAGAASQLRIPVRIGFVGRPVASTVISTRFERRLTNIPALDLKTPVAVKMDGRTAVLQGAVATERQRDLIEQLAGLEPGVSSVRNELTIDPVLGQPEPLPGANSSPVN